MAPMVKSRRMSTLQHYQAFAALIAGVVFAVAALIAGRKAEYGPELPFLLWTLAVAAVAAGVILFEGARQAAR